MMCPTNSASGQPGFSRRHILFILMMKTSAGMSAGCWALQAVSRALRRSLLENSVTSRRVKCSTVSKLPAYFLAHFAASPVRYSLTTSSTSSGTSGVNPLKYSLS